MAFIPTSLDSFLCGAASCTAVLGLFTNIFEKSKIPLYVAGGFCIYISGKHLIVNIMDDRKNTLAREAREAELSTREKALENKLSELMRQAQAAGMVPNNQG